MFWNRAGLGDDGSWGRAAVRGRWVWVGVFLSVFAAGWGAPIPSGPNARTQADYTRTRAAWLRRHTVKAFEAATAADAPWRAKAVEFLEGCVLLEMGDADAPGVRELGRLGRLAMVAGCDDAIVEGWYGWIQFREKGKTSALPYMERALASLRRGSYPRSQTFLAAYHLASGLHYSKGAQSPFTKELCEEVGLEALADAIRAGEFGEGEFNIAFRFVEWDSWPVFSAERRATVAGLLEEKPGGSAWFARMFRGTAHLRVAHEKGRPAREKEAWRKARVEFEEAWRSAPEYPESAEMVMKTMAHGDEASPIEVRLWFDRAAAAQMDYSPAYDRFIRLLKASASGGRKEVGDFALECLATKRFDTCVPQYYLVALMEIGAGFENNAWRAAFRAPGVRENLKVMFEGLMAEEERDWVKDRYLAQWALAEAWCGDYEKAARTLQSEVNLVALARGFHHRTMSWNGRGWESILSELMVFTGEHREALEKAESLNQSGNVEEAVALFTEVMGKQADSEPVERYLLKRIAMIRLGVSSRAGNAETDMGYGPLHIAAIEGRTEVIEFLAEGGLDLNAKADGQWVALSLAVKNKRADAVRRLVELGADLEAESNSGRRPLHYAIESGESALIEFLVEKGADLDAGISTGWAPLHMATDRSQVHTVRLLLEKGADANVRGNWGRTALHVAAEEDHPRIAGLLIEAGVGLDVRTKGGWTALLLAIHNKRAEPAKQLVEAGANVNARLRSGNSPLLKAIELGLTDVALALIERDADVDYDWHGMTPLWSAFRYEDLAAARALLRRGSDFNKGRYGDHSTRDMIMINASGDIMKTVVEKGIDIHSPGWRGRRPLFLAILCHHPDSAKVLIEAGADAKTPADDGATVLHFAAEHGYDEIIRMLLERGADVNARSNSGATALHHAAQYGFVDTIELLLEKGADPSAEANGYTPYHTAKQNNQPEAARVLLKRTLGMDRSTKWAVQLLGAIVVPLAGFGVFRWAKRQSA